MRKKSYSSPSWAAMVRSLGGARFRQRNEAKCALQSGGFHGVSMYRFKRSAEAPTGYQVSFTVRGYVVVFSRGTGSPSYYGRQADLIRYMLRPYAIRPRINTLWNYTEAQAKLDYQQEGEVVGVIQNQLIHLKEVGVLPTEEELQKLRAVDRAHFKAEHSRGPSDLEGRVEKRFASIEANVKAILDKLWELENVTIEEIKQALKIEEKAAEAAQREIDREQNAAEKFQQQAGNVEYDLKRRADQLMAGTEESV